MPNNQGTGVVEGSNQIPRRNKERTGSVNVPIPNCSRVSACLPDHRDGTTIPAMEVRLPLTEYPFHFALRGLAADQGFVQLYAWRDWGRRARE